MDAFDAKLDLFEAAVRKSERLRIARSLDIAANIGEQLDGTIAATLRGTARAIRENDLD